VGGSEYRNRLEGSDPHRGHKRVYEGERVHVRVRYGMVEAKLFCIRWLSPFLKLV
jgi:hypothetical protein